MKNIEQVIITKDWIIIKYETSVKYIPNDNLSNDMLEFFNLLINEEE